MGRRAVLLLLLACWLLVLLDVSPAALSKERSRRQRTTPTVRNLMPVFMTRRDDKVKHCGAPYRMNWKIVSPCSSTDPTSIHRVTVT